MQKCNSLPDVDPFNLNDKNQLIQTHFKLKNLLDLLRRVTVNLFEKIMLLPVQAELSVVNIKSLRYTIF